MPKKKFDKNKMTDGAPMVMQRDARKSISRMKNGGRLFDNSKVSENAGKAVEKMKSGIDKLNSQVTPGKWETK